MNEPVLLKPAFKDYLWGGTKLRAEYGKDCDFDRVAESWELSTHKDGQSIVASGEHCGLTLSQYIEKNGDGVLGKKGREFEFFPILVKLIDAKQNLSVQVHPSDEYALKNEGQYGKTEVWYVLSADEGACLYYGFCKDITKEEYRERIKNNTLIDVLNCVKVKKGDVFFVTPGTVHAIGAGIVICEIQQNSNVTYRVYDYGRVGADGKTRPLHIDKAIDVSDLKAKPQTSPETEVKDCGTYSVKPIASCKYFTSEEICVDKKADFKITDDSFRSITLVDGNCTLKMDECELKLKKGDTVFIPAQNADYTVCGKCSFILSYV